MSKCKFKQQRNISFSKTDIDEIVGADKKLLIYKLNGVMFNGPYYFESIHVQQNLSKSLERPKSTPLPNGRQRMSITRNNNG